MNACLTTSLMQRFHRLLGVLVFSLFSYQVMAVEPPVVVSVDHRVTVGFSKAQFDAGKGVYITQVRIKNNSGTSLFAPLRLSIDQSALQDIRLLNAQGTGKDGQPYFEFALPKGMFAAGALTAPIRVVFALDKNKDRRATRSSAGKDALSPFASAYHVSAGVEMAPLEPRAEPYALTVGSGKVNVSFGVRLLGKAKTSATVYLRRSGDRKGIAMNDQGKEGDLVAKDGIHGVRILVDATELQPDTCLNYEAVINVGHAEVVSPQFRLCVSAFPVRMAASNKTKLVVMPDGTKAVADEILITTVPNTKSDAIRRLAADINAEVVGSIPLLNLYQLKLSSPAKASLLLELVARLNVRAEVKAASVNALGSYAYIPNDPEFTSAPQHGLQLVRAHDVWDIGATGAGVTVIVLDSGLDRTHPDFVTPGVAVPTVDPNDCQLAENDCGGLNDDTLGHGTQVAGVIAAKTNTLTPRGVAGVAYGSKIHSIQVSSIDSISDGEMTTAFTAAHNYIGLHGAASVINASFSGLNGLTNWTPVCNAIEITVMNGGGPGVVVVNAIGNNGFNGNFYPGRCNDINAGLLHKDRFIPVASSASVVVPACGSVAVDHSCTDTNYGAWVDMTAPGSAIRTTAVGGGYASPSGNSFSAPMISGAAAILHQCGVPSEQIENILKTSGNNVMVSFPDGSSAPRLDIYRALAQLNHAASGIALSPSSLNENIDTALGVDVGILTATDADTCDKHTFSIVGGADAALFSINTTTNTLRLSDGWLNHEAKPSYAVTVRVTDFFLATSDFPLTVNVNNLNEAPTAINLSASSIGENNAAGAAVATLTATDPDTIASGFAAPFTFVLAVGAGDTDNGAFTITGDVLTINGVADFEAKPSYSIRVRVTDNGGLSFETAKTITINNANEAPTAINLSASSIGENNAAGAAVATLTATDPDTIASGFAAPFTFVLAVGAGDTDNGAFTITGDVLTINGVADFEVKSSYSIRVRVTDNGGQSFETTKTITINNVNEAPSFAPPYDFSHIEYNQVNMSSPPFIDYVGMVSANDPDSGDTLTFSITAGNDAVVNSVLQSNAFKFDAANPGQLFVDNRLAVNFEYKPVFNLTVRVTDQLGLFAEAAVTVNLTNDAADNGDPHITTVDGLHYDFQSAGEFVALRNAKGTEIQLRQTPVSTTSPLTDGYSGLTSGVSVNTAVAARVGKHRVTYQQNASANPASNGLVLRVDGVPTAIPADGLDLGSGGRVTSSAGGGIQIDFPDRTTLIVTPGWWSPYSVWYLNVNVFHTPVREGIMGARAKGSWLPKLSDGTALGAMPAALHDRYVELNEKFADSWRVNDTSSLFDYAPGTSTQTFTFKEWPKENPPYVIANRSVPKPLKREVAQQLCRGVVGKNNNADCMFDVMVMGDRGIAKAHLLTQKIRFGATAIAVREDINIRAKDAAIFTATVARHAAITREELRGKVALLGSVQFTLNGKNVGAPVKLDAKGQASLKVPRRKVGKQQVGARFIPARGSALMNSRSVGASRVEQVGKK